MAHCLNFGDKPSVTLTGQKLHCGSPRELPKMVACRGNVGQIFGKTIQFTPWSGLELCQLMLNQFAVGNCGKMSFSLYLH